MRYPFYALLWAITLGMALALSAHSAAADALWGYGSSMGGQTGVSAPIGNTQVRTRTSTLATPATNPDAFARYNYYRDSYNRNMRAQYAVQNNRKVGIDPNFSDKDMLMMEMGTRLGDIDPASGELFVTPPAARVMGGIQRGHSYND